MPTILFVLALIVLVLLAVCLEVALRDQARRKAAWRKAHPTLEDKQRQLKQRFESTDMSTEAYEAALNQLLNPDKKEKEDTYVHR